MSSSATLKEQHNFATTHLPGLRTKYSAVAKVLGTTVSNS